MSLLAAVCQLGAGGCAYPLDDDGTLAAMFGFGHAPTNAPDYQQSDYTYVSPATGNAAYGLPAAENAFASQAITVDAGVIIAFEWEVVAVPAGGTNQHDVGGIAFTSSGGVPTGTGFVASVRRTGSGYWFYHDNVTGSPTVTTPAGLRIGMELNGNDGSIRFLNSEGYSQVVSAMFTPGQAVSFGITFGDNGTTPAADMASVLAIFNGADMQLTYTAGAKDLCGNNIA